ncbi:hypothetical protein M8J77_014049 [Diaphorina citri]|nr:hypothetical protein M8J77_014049 [Diaphorina citri]
MLDSIHHQGIRFALGAFKSSPIASILSEAGEPPLQYRRDILTFNYLLNTQRDKRHLHTSIWKDLSSPTLSYGNQIGRSIKIRGKLLMEKYDINLNNMSPLPSPLNHTPWTSPSPTVHYDLLKFTKNNEFHQKIQSEFRELSAKFSDLKPIYTDASKNETSVSAAFCTEDSKFNVRLSPLLSICNAELMSILYAIHFILNVCQSQTFLLKFMLYSDSLSALQSIQNVFSSNPIAQEIRNILVKNKHILSLHFTWVPSHVGIVGNEEADRLAKEALSSNSPSVNTIPINYFKRFLKSKILSAWNTEWVNLADNKLRQIKEENRPWNPPFSMSRKEQVSITRLRIGHTNMTHCFLMKKDDPPQCEVCNCRLTVLHILKYCTKYQSLRCPDDLHACLSNDITSVLIFVNRANIKFIYLFYLF